MREMSSSDGTSLLHGGVESSSGDARGARRDGNDASSGRVDHDENLESSSTCLGALKAEPLLIKTIVGVMLGIVFGSIIRAANPTPRAVELIGFPGELFMRLLRALIIPLVAVTMSRGVTSLSARSGGSAKRVAKRLVASYALTTLVACALGVIVVEIVRPGVGVVVDGARCDRGVKPSSKPPPPPSVVNATAGVSAVDSLLNTARSFVPDNVVSIRGARRRARGHSGVAHVRSRGECFAQRSAAPTVALLDSLNAAIEVAVGWAISLMPPGVLSLVAGRVAGSCDPAGTLAALGKYVFSVLLGLAIHGGCVCPRCIQWRRGTGAGG